MIYLVDNTIDGQGVSPREILAALEVLRPGTPVTVEPFKDVSLGRVQNLKPSHIILSGQSHPWTDYTEDSLFGVFEVIREAEQPVLGVCGGHQQIALAYGAPVGLMKRLEPGEGYQGALRERGFFEVEAEGDGVFEGLPRRVTVWHSHCDEVKEVPEDFKLTASNETCRIQAMQHTSRPVFGVQFHPELFDQEHPQGRRILENFLEL
ncbi:MAG TPA: gamma-glutamyl-gamma-aminobutyrate hydrolase family protein [Pyrinomonadaceae bacterium]|nr:gamma-glutamyl-gamma-aminobutyrate hydrolase family protein [Pyrinomonadaceae bacterium]